jgi:CelD/BcsL family acetyltransferase involved in cellulose biosynthesis
MAGLQRLSLDDPAWGAFVLGRPDATSFHDPAWAKLLTQCYRLVGFALASRDDSGTVTAGLPVVAAPRLPLRARRLVSLPYTDFVPPLVDAGHEAEFARSLDAARRELGFDQIELRSELAAGAAPQPRGVIHTLTLDPDAGVLLNGLTKGKRRDVRAAQRLGLTVRRAQTERDLTESYFDLHLRTRRRLGVPSQPRHFFRLLWQQLIEPGRGFVLMADDGRMPVAGAVFLTANRTVIYKYAASDPTRGGLPADLLLWHAVSEACERGFTTFDFGRSELGAQGLRRYKDRWGAVERPLVYSVVGEHAEREAGPSPGGGLTAGLIRRAPVWVARVSGELLYRYAA